MGGVHPSMVDRIDKTFQREPWVVESPTESDRDKQSGQEESSQDGYAAFQEKTDWRLLFDQSKLWKKNIQVHDDEIEKILFRKINLKTDPSLLRVDIHLKTGEIITPAFISLSRMNGLKIKHFNSGEEIPHKLLSPDPILRITIPSQPELFDDKNMSESDEQPPAPTPRTTERPQPSDEAGEVTQIHQSVADEWLTRLKIRDPLTRELHSEMAIAYLLALLFVLFMGGLAFLL